MIDGYGGKAEKRKEESRKSIKMHRYIMWLLEWVHFSAGSADYFSVELKIKSFSDKIMYRSASMNCNSVLDPSV